MLSAGLAKAFAPSSNLLPGLLYIALAQWGVLGIFIDDRLECRS
jgi:hypothetical protein